MSVHVLSWVLRHSEATLADRLVLLVLADHAGEDGAGSYPSIETIAREARIDRRTAQRCLRELEAPPLKAIRREGTTRHGVSVYRVILPSGGRQIAAPGAAGNRPNRPLIDNPSGDKLPPPLTAEQRKANEAELAKLRKRLSKGEAA